MPQSSIRKLPRQVQDAVLDQLKAGFTIDQILQCIHDMGYPDISRSAVGRHTKGLCQSVLEVRKARAIAEALTDKLGTTTDEVGRANIELLQSVLLRIAEHMSTQGEVDIGELDKVSRTIKHIARAKTYKIDAISRARQEGGQQALAHAKKEVAAVAKKGGISKQALKQIEQVLG